MRTANRLACILGIQYFAGRTGINSIGTPSIRPGSICQPAKQYSLASGASFRREIYE